MWNETSNQIISEYKFSPPITSTKILEKLSNEYLFVVSIAMIIVRNNIIKPPEKNENDKIAEDIIRKATVKM